MADDKYFKRNENDKVWFKHCEFGEIVFSFDKKTDYNLYSKDVLKLSEEQIKLFKSEHRRLGEILEGEYNAWKDEKE